ncbi:MAG: ABC transporter substrate-binding protein [Porphyrobacter sp.]|nr:ABC transporter substrate-binding protein [Porphyrobacter sp.]
MKWGRLRIGAFAAFLAAMACLTAASASSGSSKLVPSGKPQRIMSTNLCSDILLLMLVPKERIASITFLAHDPVQVLLPGADAGVAINHGSAEEVVAQQPDLILTSPWSASVMQRLAGKVGAPLVKIDAANSFADIRRITRQMGAAVGEPERAEALIAEMDAKLALLEQDRPARPLEVAAWSSGDAVPGAGTLTDEIIRRAGAVNLARRVPDASYSTFGVEELLAARPDAIMRGEDRYDGPALRDAVSEHPAIRRAYAGRRISYPASLYACGLPQSADAAIALRAALAKVPQGPMTW